MVLSKIDPIEWLRKQLDSDSDMQQAMLREFAQKLMAAEADGVCGAGYGERSESRTNTRNGYRLREWDTRVGTLDLAIPKLRHGSYFPGWLLEPRRRAERALAQVVADAYLLGVSTRKVEDLVQSLGIDRISKSQVSILAKELDDTVRAFRERKLKGRYRYIWLDALELKCREQGRVVSVAALIAVGVNDDGQREVLGIDVVTEEDGAGWLAFLRGLKARGLRGVELVISDAHPGLKAAIAATLHGAAWQRCRTHFMRNLLVTVPKSAQGLVGTLVRVVFAQHDAEAVRAQHGRVVEQLQVRFPKAAHMLRDAREELLAFTSFPKEHWRQIWSNNPQERLNKEIRRRTDVVGIFPNRDAVLRLVGAVLCEIHDDWVTVRRYMTFQEKAEEVPAAITPPVRRLRKAS